MIKFKTGIKSWISFKKVHRVNKFNQKNIYRYEHRSNQKSKNDFQKYFFKLMNNAVFGKTMDSVRK